MQRDHSRTTVDAIVDVVVFFCFSLGVFCDHLRRRDIWLLIEQVKSLYECVIICGRYWE